MEPKFFEIIVTDQQFFADRERLNKVLYQLCNELNVLASEKKLYPLRLHAIYRLTLYQQLLMSPGVDGEESDLLSSEEAWEKIESLLKGDEQEPATFCWEYCRRLLVLALLQPRFDEGVSTEIGHLLACPFSLHQETTKIRVPYSAEVPFDPDQAPTVAQLLESPGLIEPYLQFFRQFC